MKIKKMILSLVVLSLSFSLMACPKVVNRAPKFVQIIDEEIIEISNVTYSHKRGTTFTPEIMIDNLVISQGITAIDYDQTKVSIGIERKYNDVSKNIVVTTFYQLWDDGDDANFDGEVNQLDEVLYGSIKTDEDGNKILDNGKITLLGILPVGNKMAFTMIVYDEEGLEAQISGEIIIVAAD